MGAPRRLSPQEAVRIIEFIRECLATLEAEADAQERRDAADRRRVDAEDERRRDLEDPA